MAFRRRTKERDTTVPTDSLSDIAFLLIIFFILTTSIRNVTGFATEFPSSERAQQQQQTDKAPAINLKDGTILLNDEQIGMEDLRRKIRELRLDTRTGDKKVVILEATGHVNYQLYYEVMSIISAAGGVVGIVTEEGASGQ